MTGCSSLKWGSSGRWGSWGRGGGWGSGGSNCRIVSGVCTRNSVITSSATGPVNNARKHYIELLPYRRTDAKGCSSGNLSPGPTLKQSACTSPCWPTTCDTGKLGYSQRRHILVNKNSLRSFLGISNRVSADAEQGVSYGAVYSGCRTWRRVKSLSLRPHLKHSPETRPA